MWFGEDTIAWDGTYLILGDAYMLPAVKVSYLLNLIFEAQGYKFVSNLDDSDLYNSLYLQYCGEESDGGGIYNYLDYMIEVDQKEFIKSIGFVLGVDFVESDEESNVITAIPFDYPLSIPAVDWSGKVDWGAKQKINRHWGEWERTNVFKYGVDNEGEEDGSGEILFGNQQLTSSYDAIELPFSFPDVNLNFLNSGRTIASVNRITELDEENEGAIEDNEDLIYRLITIEYRDEPIRIAGPVGATVTMNTNVPYAAFPDELRIPNILSQKYRMLKGMLENQPQRITVNIQLTLSDFASLSLLPLVYLNDSFGEQYLNGYYYIDEIKFEGKVSSEAVLIKVNVTEELSDVLGPFLYDNNDVFIRDSTGQLINM